MGAFDVKVKPIAELPLKRLVLHAIAKHKMNDEKAQSKKNLKWLNGRNALGFSSVKYKTSCADSKIRRSDMFKRSA